MKDKTLPSNASPCEMAVPNCAEIPPNISAS